MPSRNSIARRAGLLYFVTALLMIYGYMFVPAQFSGSASVTATKIASHELLYRASTLVALVSQVLFILVALTLYELFSPVNRALARMMVTLVCVGITAEIVNIAVHFAPLLLATNKDFQAAFSKAQIDALGDGFLVLGGNLGRFLTMFWGLWLLPFGVLTIRSGFLPRILGYALLAAGLGYVTTCVTYILFPAQLAAVTRVVSPLYFGEVPIILWLLVMGARSGGEVVRPAPETGPGPA